MVVSAHTQLLNKQQLQPGDSSTHPRKKQRTVGPEMPQDRDSLKGVRVSTDAKLLPARLSHSCLRINPAHPYWVQVFFIKGTLQAASARLRIWEPMLQKAGATIAKVGPRP